MSTCSHLIGTLLLLNVLCLLPAWGWAQAAASLTLDGAKAEEAVALTLYAEAQAKAAQAHLHCEQLQRHLHDPTLNPEEAARCRQLCEDLRQATEALSYWREAFQPLAHFAATQQGGQPHFRSQQVSFESLMAAQRHDLEGVSLRLTQLLEQARKMLLPAG